MVVYFQKQWTNSSLQITLSQPPVDFCLCLMCVSLFHLVHYVVIFVYFFQSVPRQLSSSGTLKYPDLQRKKLCVALSLSLKL